MHFALDLVVVLSSGKRNGHSETLQSGDETQVVISGGVEQTWWFLHGNKSLWRITTTKTVDTAAPSASEAAHCVLRGETLQPSTARPKVRISRKSRPV